MTTASAQATPNAAYADRVSAWVPLTWSVAGRTSGYWFETLDPDTRSELQRFSFLQTVDGSVSQLASGHVELRFAARFADADRYPGVETNHNRLYAGYAQARFGPWRAQGRFGRMFVQEGPASLTLDGLWLEARPARRVELRLWGGSQAPADLDWDVQSLANTAAAGARVLGTLRPTLRAGISWAYWEEDGRTAARPVGVEATWFPLSGLRAFARADYETAQENWRRVEFLGDYRPGRDAPWLFGVQYVDRQPRIEASTYFARFEHTERIRLVRASARYQRQDGLGAEAESFTGVIDGRTAARLSGAVLARYGRFGYSALLGDSGEDSRWFGDVHVPLTPWAQIAAGAVVTTYELAEASADDESKDVAGERELVTLFARATVDLRAGVRGVAEIQGLQNPDFDQDVRILLGLDLVAGRGASRFGVNRGGWFE